MSNFLWLVRGGVGSEFRFLAVYVKQIHCRAQEPQALVIKMVCVSSVAEKDSHGHTESVYPEDSLALSAALATSNAHVLPAWLKVRVQASKTTAFSFSFFHIL